MSYGVVCRLLTFHVKPMLICHLRGSYNVLQQIPTVIPVALRLKADSESEVDCGK